MTAIKVKNLIVQLILTVVSLAINLIAILPIYIIVSGEWRELMEQGLSAMLSVPLMFVICGVSFALNRLLFKIKGKHVDDTYSVWVEEYVDTDVDYDSWRNTITITDNYVTREKYETEYTAIGWLATFLSFIAFPMRLVSLIMAFVAMFTSRIFVTHKRLNPDMPITKSAPFTHTLFDFVIMPKSLCRVEGVKSKKCIPFILLYVALFLILNIVALMFIGRNRYAWANDWSTMVSLLIGLVVIIVDLILLIKHSILLGKAYSKKKALITLLKIMIPPVVWIVFNAVFFIPNFL